MTHRHSRLRTWRLLGIAALPLALALSPLAPPAAAVGTFGCTEVVLNTGTTGTNPLLFAVNPPGAPESKWFLTSAPMGVPGPAVAVNPNPSWVNPGTGARWITPLQGYDLTAQTPQPVPGGIYVYTLVFNVFGPCLDVARMRLCFAADDSVVIQLNGIPVGASNTFRQTTCIFVPTWGGFVAGPNVLTARVTNAFLPTGFLATGVALT